MLLCEVGNMVVRGTPMAHPPRFGRSLAHKARQRTPGHHYNASFLPAAERAEILAWLSTLHPLWEERYSKHFPPPPGQSQRRLLRPVYWLGNWQFACLDYYRPPKGVKDRCVKAEPFPAVLQRQVVKVEELARRMFRGPDMPSGWHLNTCLVNFYGSRLEGDRWVDTARVGEHKDFEPGPVASLSFGERDEVVLEQWLDDGALQLFGGAEWKERTFHRVQRVDTREGHLLAPEMPDFQTRRINLTFRYVPDVHVVPFAKLSPQAQEDVRPYMETLAQGSAFFRAQLAEAAR